MAIDKKLTKELTQNIDNLFDVVTENMDAKTRDFIKKMIMGPAFEEINKLISDSRPPSLYLIGRSGHGKSSLINALANKKVAKVGDVKPQTIETEPYTVIFEEYYSSWQVFDSRGYFETTSPEGGNPADVFALLEKDIIYRKPDVIIHVIDAKSLRNFSEDVVKVRQLSLNLEKTLGFIIPKIIVLSGVDILGDPMEWPPEEHAIKAGLIDQALKYLIEDILLVDRKKALDLNNPIRGFELDSNIYLGVVPVCLHEKRLWNIDALSKLIGNNLHENAKLDFFQGQQRRALLKEMSSSIISRFSKIAGAVGSSPIPISDIAILTPLQLLMISIVGGLSCRPFAKESAYEYLAAAGINVGVGFAIRTAAQQLIKLIPWGGFVISGGIASLSTYAIGKSAEAYFFSNELKSPSSFEKDFEENII